MCGSKPKIPKPLPPPQELKLPDSIAEGARKRRSAAAVGNGTILTGPTGVSSGALITAGPTLLGGS